MNKHMKLNHLNSKEFTCDICDKSFVAAYYLNRHRSMVHKVDAAKEHQTENTAKNNFRCV